MEQDPNAPREPSPAYLKAVARICQQTLVQARLRRLLRAKRDADPVPPQPEKGDPEASHE